MANNVSTLINAGHDAFVNLYDVYLTFPSKLAEANLPELAGLDYEGHQQKLLARIGNLQAPESSLGEYLVYYQTANILRQNAKILLNRTVSIPFRVDSSLITYKSLVAWQRLYIGPNQTEYHLPEPDEEDYFGELKIQGYNSDTEPNNPISGELSVKAEWLFKKVVCIDVSKPQFGRDAANPMEVTGTFLFYYLVPPTYSADEASGLLA